MLVCVSTDSRHAASEARLLVPEACNLSVKYTAFRCKGRFAVLVSLLKMLFFPLDGRVGAV